MPIISESLQNILIESIYKIRNKPPRDKTNKVACAPSEDSDQPGHPPSLIRVFAVCSMVAKDRSFLHADSEDSDQTGRMPRLIWVFTGRTSHFVGFVLSYHWAHSEDPDQTGRMPRLTWVFAGRTCHFVGFVTRWLKLLYSSYPAIAEAI